MLKIGSVYKGVYHVEEIKYGGMGTIYFCRFIPGGGARWKAGVPNPVRDDLARRDSDIVVLKSVSSDFYFRGDNAQLFDREALIWTTLPPHPYVVECTSVDRLGSVPLIMLEYAPGGSLRDRMNRSELPLHEALKVFRQVCVAMEFIEQFGGIHHRDLKPENILLSGVGDAKITDFGLASIQRYGLTSLLENGSGPETESEGDRFWGGTLPYMSPEHFGTSVFTTASDVYSFGAIMFEVIAGSQMVTGSTAEEFRSRHLHAPVPPMTPRVPSGLKAIIAKCVEKDPARRFQSFLALDTALAEMTQRERLDVATPLNPAVTQLEEGMTSGQWVNRGYGFAQLQRLAEALACYRRALELAPTDLVPLTNFASALERNGQSDEALVYRRRTVELHPDVPFAHFLLASTLDQRGQLEEAIEEYRIAVAGEDRNITFMRTLLLANRRLGRDSDCDEMLSLIFRTLADNPETYGDANWVNEGLMLGLQSEFLLSLRFFDAAVERFPESIDAWYNRAVTLTFLAEPKAAIVSVGRALALRPELPQARFLLGLLYLLTGDAERAGTEWARLQNEHPDHLYSSTVGHLVSVMRRTGLREVVLEIVFSGDSPSRLYYR